MRRASGSGRARNAWALWFLLALGLHALLVVLAARPPHTRATKPSAPPDVEVEIALGEFSAAAADTEADRSVTAGVLARSTRPGTKPTVAEARSAEASVEVGPERVERAEPAERTEHEGPKLSLQELGIGPQNPFVKSDLARIEKPTRARPKEATGSRFKRSMADALLREEHAKGLGPAEPALRALESAARNAEVPANSTAKFRVSTDSTGKVVKVELRESSSDPLPWRRVARRVLASLGSQLLRIPKTEHGVSFDLTVESRQQLPSGADPGLAINVLGIPLQEGSGERSARLEILNLRPKLETKAIELPSGQTAEVPTLTFGSVFSLFGDPADIGAPAQRMVHARVEALNVNAE